MASEWAEHGFEVDTVYNEERGIQERVRPDEVLYPVIQVMPMGWTWALFFANETVASIVRETCEGHGCEMREKLPVPQLWDSPTITSTYVDNVAIIGARKKDVENRAQRINEAFEQKGIPIVWSYTSPVRRLETVGCCIDFEKKTLENKAARLWRVYLAGLELVKRSKVRGKVVQVWLGHVTAIFRFSPYLLSIFDKIYRFTMITEDKRVSLWPAVRAEIQNACDLIWFARVDLGAGYISHVDMGDSADKGYALMSRSASTSLIRAACCFREKWRYVSLPDSLKELVEKVGVSREDVYDFGRLESTMRSTWSGATLSGVGLGTQYSQWLQEALQEGSWLKTSPLMSQYRAKRSMRVDVDCPALVPPLDPELLSEGTFKLLWAKRWKNPEEHIGMKEGRVALSSLKRSARVLSLCGKRKLTICDNLPVVIFFEKGRSSRPGPNRLCRISAAIQAGLGIRWRLRHVETKRNLADTPSRLFEAKHRIEQSCGDGNISEFVSSSLPVSVRLHEVLFLPETRREQGGPDNPEECGPPRAMGDRDASASSRETSDKNKARVHVRLPPGLHRKGCFWEIFSGSGKLSKTFESYGWAVLPPIDKKTWAGT